MKVKIFIDDEGETAKEQFDYWNLYYGDGADVHSVDAREVGGKMVISILYKEK